MGKPKSRTVLCGVVLASATVLSSAAYAASASTALKPIVTISSACVVSVTDMNFGTLATVIGTETATSTLNVTCTSFRPFYVSFLSTGFMPTRTSTMKNPANNTIGFTMAFAGEFGTGAGWTTITGTLAATPSPAPGVYKSVETVYVIY